MKKIEEEILEAEKELGAAEALGIFGNELKEAIRKDAEKCDPEYCDIFMQSIKAIVSHDKSCALFITSGIENVDSLRMALDKDTSNIKLELTMDAKNDSCRLFGSGMAGLKKPETEKPDEIVSVRIRSEQVFIDPELEVLAYDALKADDPDYKNALVKLIVDFFKVENIIFPFWNLAEMALYEAGMVKTCTRKNEA